MEKIIKYKWKISALTIVTLPLSLFVLTNTTEKYGNIIIFIGMFPLLFAATVELLAEALSGWRQYKETGEFTTSENEGSPIGNRIAIVLAILFGLIFVLPIAWVMLKNLM